MNILIKIHLSRDGDMAQQLRTLGAFVEDAVSVPK